MWIILLESKRSVKIWKFCAYVILDKRAYAQNALWRLTPPHTYTESDQISSYRFHSRSIILILQKLKEPLNNSRQSSLVCVYLYVICLE